LNDASIAKCAQNAQLVQADRMATPLTDGCNNNWMVQLSPFN